MKLHRIGPMVLCVAACMFTAHFSPTVRAELKPATPAKSRAALPAEVREMTPAGAASLHFGRLLPGPKGEARLVHIWANQRKTENPYSRPTWHPSPFCVDLFEAGDKPKTWRYLTSAVYAGGNNPSEVEARWLQPKKKQGPVLVLVTPAYMHTLYTVITFPHEGTYHWDKSGAVQEYSQGGVGGGKSVYNFGIDERGYMTVENESSYTGKLQSKTVYAWNGREYAAPATKEPATEE